MCLTATILYFSLYLSLSFAASFSISHCIVSLQTTSNEFFECSPYDSIIVVVSIVVVVAVVGVDVVSRSSSIFTAFYSNERYSALIFGHHIMGIAATKLAQRQHYRYAFPKQMRNHDSNKCESFIFWFGETKISCFPFRFVAFDHAASIQFDWTKSQLINIFKIDKHKIE